jgi:hypothetical protein
MLHNAEVAAGFSWPLKRCSTACQEMKIRTRARLSHERRVALVDLQSTLDPDSPLSVHLNETLDRLTETSRSIGAFTDYLQRNPSAVIRGKYVPERDR